MISVSMAATRCQPSLLNQRGKMAAAMDPRVLLLVIYSIVLLLSTTLLDAKKLDFSNLVEEVTDIKDFKKLLRTKTNVLILFTRSGKESSEIMKIFVDVADQVKGQGTLAYVDCSGDAKKMCKKLKVSPSPLLLKHYKDGEYHKDYDRKETVQSMVNFMRDPSGDVPWEEDDSLGDIVHIPDAVTLGKLLKKETKPLLLMFYAPWCGFCKRLKPQYAEAATELKGHSTLAAMDVNKPENAIIRQHFNITGFPTLIYFEHGNLKFRYEGENSKDGIVNFMKNPGKQPEKPKEEEWSDVESDVVHLTEATFDNYLLKESSVLVMFYAPWCGHCKAMKPEYVDAASKMKDTQVHGTLAAVDATKETSVATRFNIRGYPTVKYFKNGEFAFDVNFRTADKIIEFMKDPKEPPPPPPPEQPWSETESDVVHLDTETFKPFLKKKKHALVMFYAPWCGHCKKAKPEFMDAASAFKEDLRVAFAAVDCTLHQQICSSYEVQGYPTIKYFSYLKTVKAYEGGRNKDAFVSFMKDPQNPQAGLPPPPPKPEDQWNDIAGAQHIQHLTDRNFDAIVNSEDSVLVMFYAPWCGHCKAMKPAYGEAAAKLKSLKIPGVLAAVDATVESNLQAKYGIRGYPTLKYFRKGKVVSEYDRSRSTEDLIAFMKNPPKPKDEL